MGSPIRKSPDQFLFANPRSLSQLTTSFLAFGSQGILRSLFFSFSRTIVNHNSTTNVSCVLLVLPYEIAVPTTRKNSNLLSDYNLFFYLVISLSIVNELTLFALHSCAHCIIKRLGKVQGYRALNIRELVSRSRSKKEVFQPHLPVRLPCYDLAPITSFALGRSLRSRTSGTPGFHGLTGGVYKARERIHRAMADARLLANPASRSRVADFDPN